MQQNQNSKKLVWDFPVRLFHWLLVLALAAQWFTAEQGEDWLEWHFYIGYFTIGLIVFRLLWGIVGTRYARFSSFVPSPKTLLAWFKGQNSEHIGHPPLGALMVIFLLFIVLAQGISGLFTTDDIFSDGPWREVLSSEMQDIADWVHGNFFTVIQIAAAIHIAAAFYYLLIKKNNLILPMITGKKTVKKQDGIKSSKLLTAFIVLAIVGVSIYFLVTLAPVPTEDDFYY